MEATPAPALETVRRRRILGKALAIALLALACVLSFWVGGGFRSQPPANGGLQVPEGSLDFGEVWESSSFPWTLPIHNPTTKDISITHLASSCNCVQIGPRSLLVRAGETTSIPLKLNLMAAREGDDKTGYFSAQVIPNVEDAQGPPRSWTITGRVRKGWLRADTKFVDFGEGIIEGDKPPTRSVKLVADPAVRQLSPIFDPSKVAVSLARTAGQAEDYRLEITPQQSLPLGYFTSDIKMRATFADGSEAEVAPLPVKGLVTSDIIAIPSRLLLGARQIGDEAGETVVFQSLGPTQFVVEGFDTMPEQTKVVPLVCDLPHARAYRMSQRVSKLGSQTTDITCLLRTEHGEARRVTVRLECYGLPPSDSP